MSQFTKNYAKTTRLGVSKLSVREKQSLTDNATDKNVWRGRFPYNDIISLLDVNRPLNLAESTSQDLSFGELVNLVGMENLRDLKLGYGPSAGVASLRKAVATMCNVPAENVISTQGTALGLFLLAFEVCRAGDEAVLATPCFPLCRDTLLGTGVHLHEVKLSFEDNYKLDLNKIAACLTPKTKLVSIASPQNPSGVQTSPSTIKELLVLLERRCPDALLFIDETYREATYGDAAPLESYASLDPRIITGASVSKALGAPGLRVGWLTVADAELRKRLLVAKMNLVICGSVLDETLAAELLQRREIVLQPRRQMLASALKQVSKWCDEHQAQIEWVHPHAGALCCLRLRENKFDESAVARFWNLLPEHDLQLASGEWFGESKRAFRLGFGYLPPERLGPALSALSKALSAAGQR
jgi:aspartate/methionine/tyrosine aminotransferase